MKRFLLIINLLFTLSLYKTKAQSVCDSISVDTVYINGNSLNIIAYNSSSHFIAYPFFKAILNVNQYIQMSDTLMVPTFLSIPSDANLGYTSAFYSGTIAPEASVPSNTVFTGTLTISDPNDGTFICTKVFSFNYGTLNTSINKIESSLIEVYPNPSSGSFFVFSELENAEIIVTDALGNVLSKSQIIQNHSSLMLYNSGIYNIQIKTSQGTMNRKLIVFR